MNTPQPATAPAGEQPPHEGDNPVADALRAVPPRWTACWHPQGADFALYVRTGSYASFRDLERLGLAQRMPRGDRRCRWTRTDAGNRYLEALDGITLDRAAPVPPAPTTPAETSPLVGEVRGMSPPPAAFFLSADVPDVGAYSCVVVGLEDLATAVAEALRHLAPSPRLPGDDPADFTKLVLDLSDPRWSERAGAPMVEFLGSLGTLTVHRITDTRGIWCARAVADACAPPIVDAVEAEAAADAFEARLVEAGAPLPWRLCEEEPGCVIAADAGDVVQVDVNRGRGDAHVSAIAEAVVIAVNRAGGFLAAGNF